MTAQRLVVVGLVLVALALGFLATDRAVGGSEPAPPRTELEPAALESREVPAPPLAPDAFSETPTSTRTAARTGVAQEAPPTSPLVRLRFVSAEYGHRLPEVAFEIGRREEGETASTWRLAGLGDEHGEAELIVPEDAWLSISVDGTTDRGMFYERFAGPAGGEEVVRTVALPTGLDLVWYGRVESDGDPVAGARVTVWAFDEDDQPVRVVETETDAAGLVRLDSWSWKPVDAKVEADDVGFAITAVEEGHETPSTAQVIPLWPTGRLRATVVDGGDRPLSGVAVTLSCGTWDLRPRDADYAAHDGLTWTAETDAEGVAVLSGVPAELMLSISLARDGDELFRKERAVTLVAGESIEERFTIGTAGTVTVRVLDPDGLPLVGVQVVLVENTWEETTVRLLGPGSLRRSNASGTTDAGGRVRFEDVPLGAWFVGVAESPPGSVCAARPVFLTHEQHHVDETLELEPSLAVAGRFVDEEGNGVGGVTVTVFGRDFGGNARDDSGDDGAFRVEPMVPGTYWLSYTPKSGPWVRPRPTEVIAGTEDLEIVLRPGGRIQGVLRAASSGELVEGALVQTFAYESTYPNARAASVYSTDGTFVLTGLDSGLHALRPRTTAGSR